MFEGNQVPKYGLLGLLLPFAYLFAISWQPRASDLSLTGDEMYWPEKIFIFLCMIPVFATYFLSLYRAHRAGSWPWFLGCLFVWPLSFVYTLIFNRGDSP